MPIDSVHISHMIFPLIQLHVSELSWISADWKKKMILMKLQLVSIDLRAFAEIDSFFVSCIFPMEYWSKIKKDTKG